MDLFELQIKEVMLDSANQTIAQLKSSAAEERDTAAGALSSLQNAELRLAELNPAENESLRFSRTLTSCCCLLFPVSQLLTGRRPT